MEMKAIFSSFDTLGSSPHTSIDPQNTDAKNELNRLLIWCFLSHFRKIGTVFIQSLLRSLSESGHATRTTRGLQSVVISGRKLTTLLRRLKMDVAIITLESIEITHPHLWLAPPNRNSRVVLFLAQPFHFWDLPSSFPLCLGKKKTT